MKRKELEAFVTLAKEAVAYTEGRKAVFHKDGRRVLGALAKALGLGKGSFEIRSNKGGIAVSGEVILHTDNLYVQFSQGVAGGDTFLWRTCKGRKDYVGGRNIWEGWQVLLDLPALAERMKEVVAASSNY